MQNHQPTVLLDRIQMTSEDIEYLNHLRGRQPARTAKMPQGSRGGMFADAVTNTVGSWRFILIQSSLLTAWIVLNVAAWIHHWDPYPFILLNLALSFQAAYATPFILMSQNRQSETDRARAQQDLDCDIKAELEIELLHEKLDNLRESEITELREMVTQQSESIKRLEELLVQSFAKR
jgi:uncharacterized membrane protein